MNTKYSTEFDKSFGKNSELSSQKWLKEASYEKMYSVYCFEPNALLNTYEY